MSGSLASYLRLEHDVAAIDREGRCQPRRIQWARLGHVLGGTLIGGLLIVAGQVSAQPSASHHEAGRYLMQSYSADEYGAHQQNWDVVQDHRGFIFVANGAGVLEYDGVSWRLIRTANRSVARSLAVGPKGRVYVGAVGEIGFLSPGADGQLNFISLVDRIPEGDREFSDVWQTFSLSDGVYFLSEERLFRWRDEQIEVWRLETKFYRGFAVHDTFYAAAGAGELFVLEQDELRLAPGGLSFADRLIYAIVPHGSDAFIAVTRRNGLVRCRRDLSASETCRPYGPELTSMLAEIEPYSAVVLPDETLVIGTRRGGLVFIDRDARPIRKLGVSQGLRSDAVWAAYIDLQGGLWLGLNDGLARVQLNNPLSYFDSTLGLPETVVHVARHRGRLHAATSRGVSVLEPADAGVPRFVPVEGISKFCWFLLSTEEGLLAGCEGGVYNLDRGQHVWELPRRSAYVLHRSKKDRRHLFVGVWDGLVRFTLEDGTWRESGRFTAIQEQIRTIAEDDQGQLWLGTRASGVLRVQAGASPSSVEAVRRFGPNEGLPVGWLETNVISGEVRVMVDELGAILRFDPKMSRFVVDDAFNLGGASIRELTEDDQGRVWTVAGQESTLANPVAGGGYSLTPSALRGIPSLRPSEIIAESDGAVWIPSALGLVRLDPGLEIDADADFSVWIRRVSAPDGSPLPESSLGESEAVPEWPFESNALRFSFAAPRFDSPERTQYRARLEGFDNDWSPWSLETYRDFTNLWEGDYVFRVQARDVYGFEGREDTFAFRILPPWYRAWWAYSLYGLLLVSIVLTWVRFQRRKLQRELAINARLREVDRLKDEFLAGTSHELRTPLFGITGLAEALIRGSAGELPEAAKTSLQMIAGSGHRLGRLVSSILDHSRLSKGSLRLEREPVDLGFLVATVIALQSSRAEEKQLELRNDVPADLPLVDADETRLEQILHTLVDNGIKFTEKGYVSVSASAQGEWIQVTVKDTGIGVAEHERQRIFEAFQQVDSGAERAFGGTGLGLALAHRLVDAHGGSLEIESTIGKGACFSFSMPIASKTVPSDPPARKATRPLRPGTVASSGPAVDAGSVSGASSGSTRSGISGVLQAERLTKPSDLPEMRRLSEARILVVDDEPVNRLVLSQSLLLEGYRVELAKSGMEALRLLEDQSFDLMLLDVMMPKMSGHEVCRTLRKYYSLQELPVIFLTAGDRIPDLVKCLDAGGNDYIPKPVDQEELAARVRTHLKLLSLFRRLNADNERLSRGFIGGDPPGGAVG